MIWFFLAGMVAGAVGMIMFAHYWVHKHAVVIKTNDKEENKND